MFESIIEGAASKLGIGGDTTGSVLAALLRYLVDPSNGGFSGFLDKFRSAGLGSIVDSWVGGATSESVSADQVTAALGSGAISSIASDAGVSDETAASTVAAILPGVVDKLTPNAEIPDNDSIFSKIGGFLSDWGGAIGGAVIGGAAAATALAGNAADKVGDAAEATYDKGKEVLSGGIDAGKDVLNSGIGAGKDVLNSGLGAVRNVGSSLDDGSGGGSILKWLLPLILLGLALLLGFWFCGKPQPGANTAGNMNANKPAANANANSNMNANANMNSNMNSNANAAAHSLTEVTLPNGTKLQAYPGGIEDQLVKFIGSDAYKTATPESLKEKWFDFDDLNFKFGKTELEDSSKRQLDNIVAILKAYPDVKIKVGAYTDKKGDDAANLKLSEGRAKTVKDALDKAGVGAQVPEAEGYGEKMAKVDENASDDARKVDRKTAIRLIK